jgi:adenylate cyclase
LTVRLRPSRKLDGDDALFVFCEQALGRWYRAIGRAIPRSPRCKLCARPFGGLGRVLPGPGFSPSRKNPNLCRSCFEQAPLGCREMEIGVLFADVRDYTALSESRPTTEVTELMNRFYELATDVLLRHDAVIDKLIGDEVMAFFVHGITGAHYRRRAVEAGIDLLRAVGYGTDSGPWIELGVAVNAGVAYVGNVGADVVDFTALGDPVNVAARMQQSAAAGELLVAEGVDDGLAAAAPRRTLTVRGREQPVEAVVLTA